VLSTAFYSSLHQQNYFRRFHSVLFRVKIEPDWNDLSYHGFLRLNAAVQSLGPGGVRAATTMGMFALPKVQSLTSQVTMPFTFVKANPDITGKRSNVRYAHDHK
jgi:hypothetical protein